MIMLLFQVQWRDFALLGFGNVKSGHWFSGITLDNGSWFMIDDLSVHRPFSSVDHSSSKTITLLLLIADSMFK